MSDQASTTPSEPADATESVPDPAQPPMLNTSEAFAPVEGVAPYEELGEPRRAHGASDAGSPAAAAGSVPAGAVEQTANDNPYPAATWERPVTGVHRPAAPDGEVAAE